MSKQYTPSNLSIEKSKTPEDGQENVTPKQQSPATGKSTTVAPKATPAAIRTRQIKKLVAVGSPSDGAACMSPCSQKLLGKKITSDNVHHPAMLRPKRLQHLTTSGADPLAKKLI